MPLDAKALGDDLTALFEGRKGFPESTADAAKAWAKIYRDYAANGRAGTAAPLATGLDTAETNLAKALDPIFTAARGGAAKTFATDLDAAFVAFWFTPPVQFAAPPVTGAVTAAPPGVLGPALATVFTAGAAAGSSAADQAKAVAAAIDTWTRTVIVTITPPVPPSPVPLT
ncbi:hypothetical protein ACIBQ1_24080 [Nonomuraea sp. NPDC050153]|uniref:hypothetical protein n=1 Tax=Nonomuraea sp. NPDC050153 TaxID=3364359 RepID=UPI0037B0C52B